MLRSTDCTGMSVRHPRELFSPSLSLPHLLTVRSHATVRTRAAEESDRAKRPPCTQSRSRSEIIETFVLKGCKSRNSFKRIICLYLIKDSIFYEIIITVFQFTQCASENRSTCHAWHMCRRLPTPVLEGLRTPLQQHLGYHR